MAPASPFAPAPDDCRSLDTRQEEQAKTGLRGPELSSPDDADDGHHSYSGDPLSTDPVLSLTRLAKARLESACSALRGCMLCIQIATVLQQISEEPVIHWIQCDRSHKLSARLALNLAQSRSHGCLHELMDVRENSRRWTAYAQVVFKR